MFKLTKRQWNQLPAKAKHTSGRQNFIRFYDYTKGIDTTGTWLAVEIY